MKFFTICPACKKWRWKVSRKAFYSKALHTTLTPNNEMCTNCIKIYQSIKNPNLDE